MKIDTVTTMPVKKLAEQNLRKARADDFSYANHCSYCGKAAAPPHVDDYHRFTQLCGRCYSNVERNYATAYKIKGEGYRNSVETECNDSGKPVRQ
jgi:hypothetical protein